MLEVGQEIQYSIKVLKGKYAERVINRIFTIEEIENDGIASWLTNHGYYNSVQGAISQYVEIISRELINL